MNIKDRLEALPLPGFVKDILFVIVVVGTISIISQIALGLWTPMVAVESGSMVPNLNIGDIIVVQGASRTEVVTWEEGEKTGYRAFNLPGDVILYRPYGKDSLNLLDQVKMLIGISPGADKATPIIHRALRWVNESEPMWEGGPEAPFSGYITKGDHNEVIDQEAGQIFGVARASYLLEHQGQVETIGDSIFLDMDSGLIIYETGNQSLVGDGISYLVPVKEDWVIGVARVKIPIVGYIRLIPNIIAEQVQKLL
ncbi:MAG: S26 family signal peptidase [Methanotrichaceae archaeon]|nr:S26 family signal peptidase [Methanotrichaceae archaeon]